VFPQTKNEKMKKSIKQIKHSLTICAMGLICQSAIATPLYFNGFETDTNGWSATTRVASGTGGITSSSGSFHGTAAATGTFTRWGGYNYGAGNAVPTVFQEYWTSVDIYLNVAGGWVNNTRFDFSSAINNAAGTHLSDFIFNAGFYNDATGPGAGTDRFVISASNNSQPGSAFAKNPAKDPFAIGTSGWYTFEHHFYDVGGTLWVEMAVLDSAATVLHNWNQNTGFLIPAVGGNRYGWFDFNEFSTLAFDNTELRTSASSVPDTGSTLGLSFISILGVVGLSLGMRRKVA